MKTTAKMKRSTFAAMNYKVIGAPGKYILVASNTNRVYDEKLGKYKHIVNLRAITEGNTPLVKDKFGDKEEIEISELNGLTMSGNIIENDFTPALPLPGEKVTVVIDWVEGRNGKVLAITKLFVAKTTEAKSFGFDDAVSSDEKAEQSISATGHDAEKATASSKKNESFA